MPENYTPLIIGANEIERAVLRRAFGKSDVTIISQGRSCIGLRASCLMITPNVDRSSDWFQSCALTRLMHGGEVFTIKPEWHLRFNG